MSAEVVKPVVSADGSPVKAAALAPKAQLPAAQALAVTQAPGEPTEDVADAGPEATVVAPDEQNSQPLPPPPPIDPSIPIGPKVGLRAPDFTLQAMDGKTYRLSELAGRPVLINYWATWCIPCKAEIPTLQKLYQEYQPKGLVLISVDAIDQDSTDKVQGIVDQFGMTFPVLLDQGSQFANLYGAMFFPTTVLVDASGVIRLVHPGDATETELRTNLEKLMAGGL